MADRLFDTFPTVLGNAKVSPSQFAIMLVDSLRMAPGGLAGVLDRFRTAGYDDAVRSWVGSGKNLSLTPQEVQQVLGPEIEILARAAVVSPQQAATETASLIPQLVDKLTPGGHMPDEATLAGYFEQLKAKIGML
jgi:uncharacterized protein YidB (DUF937 family)